MTGLKWETAIAEVQEDDVVVRGHRLSELVGKTSYVQMTFLLIRGALPSAAEESMLNAIMVSLSDHGISPSSTVARMLASCGTPFQASMAGAMLSIADWHGGSGEQLGRALHGLVDDAQASAHGLENRLADAASAHVQRSSAAGERIPGFGHPQHKDGDPRAGQLLRMATELGLEGQHVLALRSLGAALATQTGRAHLGKPNVTGALAAILLDLGFPWQSIRGLVISSRTVGLTAHIVEEMQQGNKWRHVPASDVTYTGPRP